MFMNCAMYIMMHLYRYSTAMHPKLRSHLEMLQTQQKEVTRPRLTISRKDLMKQIHEPLSKLLQPQTKSLPGESNLVIANTLVNFFNKVEGILTALNWSGVDDGRLLLDCHQAEVKLETLPTVTPSDTSSLVRKCPTKSCALDPLPTWLLKMKCFRLLHQYFLHKYPYLSYYMIAFYLVKH